MTDPPTESPAPPVPAAPPAYAAGLGIPLPRVIGHRGAAAHAPENTLAGIRRAAALGVAMVELDVKLTADGGPVLMHDDRLDRTTDGRGAVRDMAYAALGRLDAGRWFDPAFAGERVPRLEEALALAATLGLGVNLELKPCRGRERETAERALAAARSVWPADRPPPLVSSFRGESLRAARAVLPDWPRGWLIGWRRPLTWRAQALALAAAAVIVPARPVRPRRLAAYRSLRRPLLAYTVNDPALALRLFALGVAAVFSDRPDAILAALRSAEGGSAAPT